MPCRVSGQNGASSRTIGLARATAKITLANLTYNGHDRDRELSLQFLEEHKIKKNRL
jgi:hypothetical protein